MNDTDNHIINQLQQNFPLCERPYEKIADSIGIDIDELFKRVKYLTDTGVIRRVGVSLNSKKMGFASTLAAVRVSQEAIEEASETIAKFPEVTHSYLRDDDFNIWFTLIAENNQRINEILDQIKASLSLENCDILNLPAQKLYKLDARFNAAR